MVKTIFEEQGIHADYTEFFEGDIIVGTIMKQLDNDEIYMVEQYTDTFYEISEGLNQFWSIPSLFEKFLLCNDEGLAMRAIRVPLVEQQHKLNPMEYMNIYFMDTGESFCFPIAELPFDKMFELSEEAKYERGMAIKCRVLDIDIEESDMGISEFITASIAKKLFTFEIIARNEDMLEVVILPYDEHATNEEFDSDMDVEEEEEEVEKESDEEDDNINVILYAPATETKGVSMANMTEAEKEIWNEEPLNINNPQIAIQGFETKDDEAVCKFYDPALGGCFKGGRCKLSHVTPLPDGICRDTKEIYYDNIERTLPLPRMHSTVKIEITSMVAVNLIYCRYVGNKKTKEGYDLEMLIGHMSQEEEVATYQPLGEEPAKKQLVILKDVDGKYYRGRIESFIDDSSDVKVLLVDFGCLKHVHFKKLFEWCPRFDYLPFQAVEMEIANIATLEGRGGQSLEQILKVLNDEPLKAQIVDIFPIVRCVLYNVKGEDVKDKLVGIGLVKGKEIAPPLFSNKSVTIIPG